MRIDQSKPKKKKAIEIFSEHKQWVTRKIKKKILSKKALLGKIKFRRQKKSQRRVKEPD